MCLVFFSITNSQVYTYVSLRVLIKNISGIWKRFKVVALQLAWDPLWISQIHGGIIDFKLMGIMIETSLSSNNLPSLCVDGYLVSGSIDNIVV